MAQLFEIPVGWTKELGPFTLRQNGVAMDLTGWTVTLQSRPQSGSTFIDTVGDTRVDPDQVTNRGKVYFKPDVDDFRSSKSPYTLRWKIVDGVGDIIFVPNGAPDTCVIHKV